MELILPVIVVLSILMLGGREGTEKPPRPASDADQVQDSRRIDDESGCAVVGRRYRDLTLTGSRANDRTDVEHRGD